MHAPWSWNPNSQPRVLRFSKAELTSMPLKPPLSNASEDRVVWKLVHDLLFLR